MSGPRFRADGGSRAGAAARAGAGDGTFAMQLASAAGSSAGGAEGVGTTGGVEAVGADRVNAGRAQGDAEVAGAGAAAGVTASQFVAAGGKSAGEAAVSDRLVALSFDSPFLQREAVRAVQAACVPAARVANAGADAHGAAGAAGAARDAACPVTSGVSDLPDASRAPGPPDECAAPGRVFASRVATSDGPHDSDRRSASALAVPPGSAYAPQPARAVQPAPAAPPALAAVEPALAVERIAVRDGIAVFDVVRSPHAPARTTPELAAAIERACPGISRHACVNGEGDTFAAVIDHTSLAHVLEHLVVHLQVRAEPPGSAATFLGTTEPLDAEGLRFRVEVSFRDDLAVLRALREALDLLNGLLADA